MRHDWKKKKKRRKINIWEDFFLVLLIRRFCLGWVFLFVYLLPLLKRCQPSGFPRVTPAYVASVPSPSD